MLRTIESHNGFAIQKVCKPNGSLLRYQTVAVSSVGDASQVTPHARLCDARKHIGATVVTAPSSLTAPKSTYAQNQKGYRADSAKAKKT